MIVTRIRPRGKRIVVEFDEGEALTIAQDVALKFILYTGKNLDDDQRAQLKHEQEFFDAVTAAHRFIGYRARSEREVRDKLRGKKIAPETIERTIALLRLNGSLNDADFSWKFVHDAMLKKPIGRIRMKQELRRKGLNDETIERALGTEYDNAREIEAAIALTARRRRTRQNEHPAELAQYLRSRGFTSAAIEAAVKGENGEGLAGNSG